MCCHPCDSTVSFDVYRKKKSIFHNKKKQILYFLQPSLKSMCNTFYLIIKQKKKNTPSLHFCISVTLVTQNNSRKDKCNIVNQLDISFSLDLNLEKNVPFSPFMLEYMSSISIQRQHKHIFKNHLRGKLHETLISFIFQKHSYKKKATRNGNKKNQERAPSPPLFVNRTVPEHQVKK